MGHTQHPLVIHVRAATKDAGDLDSIPGKTLSWGKRELHPRQHKNNALLDNAHTLHISRRPHYFVTLRKYQNNMKKKKNDTLRHLEDAIRELHREVLVRLHVAYPHDDHVQMRLFRRGGVIARWFSTMKQAGERGGVVRRASKSPINDYDDNPNH